MRRRHNKPVSPRSCRPVGKHALELLVGLLVSIAALFGTPDIALAERVFGTGTISYEHVRRESALVSADTAQGTADTAVVGLTDDLTRESLLLTYEGALFTKNTLRLTANLQRREYPYSDYHDFQPIYYADLTGYGYAFNLRYSPYSQRSQTAGLGDLIDVQHRDWRFSGTVSYDRYPSLSVVYSSLKTYDEEEVRRYDGLSRNWVVESAYQYGSLNARGNYSRLKRANNLSTGTSSVTETWSGSTGFSKALSSLGYASVTYNYYDTRQESGNLLAQKSRTNTVTSLATFSAVHNLTVTASYAGRFTQSQRQATDYDTDDQNLAARAEYGVTSYLTGFAGKGYQISGQSGGYSIVEYVNVGGTATRYLRNGVDTRITYNRTIFQQSERIKVIRDADGNEIETVNDGEYALDTYHASLNFKPRPYIQTYLDISLSRNSDPVDIGQRYQFTRSIDTRFNFTRRLEGRFTFTSLYQGDVLKLSAAFSENYNAGLTYIPRDNININLTLIYSTYAGTIRSENTSLTGYASYTFRRAFSLYTSYNYRDESRERVADVPAGVSELSANPITWNSQLLMYLGSRTTLSVSYIRNETISAFNREIVDESIQTVLTLQI